MPQMKADAAQNRTANFNKSYSLGSNLSQNMVNVAYAQIGKTGVDLNYTENWCADFVSDCAELSGYGSAVPRNANCTNLYNAIKNAGGTDIDKSQAQPGDIVFYDNNKSPNGIADHVEIVYSGTGESLLSIGGNTGSSSVSSAKVCSPRNHPYVILHIIRSAGGYTITNDDELGIPYPRPQVSSTVWLGKNGITSGDYVRWLQTALNKVDNAGLAVDGQFGSGTTTAVKNFQAKHGLTQDGQAGTSTINKLVEIIKGQMNPTKPPSWAWISATDDRTDFCCGEQIHFWFSADETHEAISSYTIGIDKEGERIITESFGRDYYISFDEPGNYSVYVSAYNSAGWADSNVINLRVIKNLPGSYLDVGTDFYAIIANSSTKYLITNHNGNAIFYSPTERTDQYWHFSRNDNGSYTIESYDRMQALDVAGGEIADEEKYVKLEIVSKPDKLVYNVGDKLNTEGLVIKKVYEIGRSFTTTSGFTVDKNVLKLGDNKVTVTYDGKSITFDIIVNSLKGDINSDGKFNVSDAVILQKWLLAVPNTKLADWKAADLCEDDKLDAFDMIEMRKLLIENK